jgi:hypothetical protein
MNIGPNSEMKIESYSGRDSGVIDLVKGKIRSQVTKDYLQMEDPNKSKIFVKTKNAVMGVRGTDFLITTNGKTSSVILFEGEVLFGNLNTTSKSTSRLEEIVNRGVKIYPGEFSVVEKRGQPTIPAILNPRQMEILEKTDDMGIDRKPSSIKASSLKSVIPKGLTGNLVMKDEDSLLKDLKESSIEINQASRGVALKAEGFLENGKLKPANGSFLHIESGVIIPPSSDSTLDSITNSYVDSSSLERVDSSGEYQPPQGVEITSDGKVFVISSSDANKIQINKPVPVLNSDSLTQFSQNGIFERKPSSIDFDQIRNTTNSFNRTNNPDQDFRIQNQVENVRRTTTTTIRVRSGTEK